MLCPESDLDVSDVLKNGFAYDCHDFFIFIFFVYFILCIFGFFL